MNQKTSIVKGPTRKVRTSPSQKTIGEACRRMKSRLYVGLDVHKKTIHVAVMNDKKRVIVDKEISTDFVVVRAELRGMPPNTKYVMESSSVWRGMYRFMTKKLKLDVVVSNPLRTYLISKSKTKTDKRDAITLADMLRTGHISTCYVPGKKTEDERNLVRYRDGMVWNVQRCKIKIRAILNQEAISIPGNWNTPAFMHGLAKLDDYRINGHLRMINLCMAQISMSDREIREAVKNNEDAALLTTFPDIGSVTALALASSIDGISRFSTPERLKSYFGLNPTVRNSAESTRHGHISHAGDPLIRKLMVQAAWVHVRHFSDSPITQYHMKLAKRMPARKAIVATANKMLKYVFWMLVKHESYNKFVDNQSGRKT